MRFRSITHENSLVLRIGLTKGLYALVDDDCPSEIREHKWHVSGTAERPYACRRVWSGKQSEYVSMHRLIAGATKDEFVDHINGNTLDNRRENLRRCSPKENVRNQKLSARSTSGYKGVSYRASRGKWQAYISPNGKRINLGHHTTAEEAARAYNVAALEHFGEFARLNDA